MRAPAHIGNPDISTMSQFHLGGAVHSTAGNRRYVRHRGRYNSQAQFGFSCHQDTTTPAALRALCHRAGSTDPTVGRLHHHLSRAHLMAGHDEDRAKGTVVLGGPLPSRTELLVAAQNRKKEKGMTRFVGSNG
jgi:hypothetical protein